VSAGPIGKPEIPADSQFPLSDPVLFENHPFSESDSSRFLGPGFQSHRQQLGLLKFPPLRLPLNRKESPAMYKWIFRVLAVSLLGTLSLAAQAPPKAEGEKKQDAADKKPEAAKDKGFAEVIKDAKVIKGLFTFYQTEEQTYLEILPDQFDKTYMLSLTCESGIGEAGFYAAANCGDTAVMFHKQGKIVQLVAKNTRFVAEENSPMERAVRRSFSDSILGSAKLESLPQPER